MNSKQVIRLLEKDGWRLKTQSGSHKQFIHPIKPGKVTVSRPRKERNPSWNLKQYIKTSRP